MPFAFPQCGTATSASLFASVLSRVDRLIMTQADLLKQLQQHLPPSKRKLPQQSGLVVATKRLSHVAADPAACAALECSGAVSALHDSLGDALDNCNLEQAYYAALAIEHIVVASSRRAAIRDLCQDRILALVIWCAEAHEDVQQEAHQVGQQALSLLSLLADGLSAGQVGFMFGGTAGGFVALCTFAACWTADEAELQAEGASWETCNIALRMLRAVVEEYAWLVEPDMPEDDLFVAVALALCASAQPRAAQLLQRYGGVPLLAMELVACVAGEPALSCDDARWPTVDARRAVLMAACQAILKTQPPASSSVGIGAPATAPAVSPLASAGAADTAAKPARKKRRKDRAVEGVAAFLSDARQLQQALKRSGEDALQESLMQALEPALAVGTPSHEGDEFPEADYAHAVATEPSEVVARQASERAINGCVTLTRHGAWLALRFNHVEQGISYAAPAASPGPARLQTDVVGFEYIRVLLAAGLASMAVEGVHFGASEAASAKVLVVGLGTGALPAFLAGVSRALDVRVAEWDSAVIDVMRDAAGLSFEVAAAPVARAPKRPKRQPAAAPSFRVVHGDAAVWVRAEAGTGAAAVFLDPYEATGSIPAHLRATSFLRDCAAALSADGIVVANLFNGVPGTPAHAELMAFIATLHEAMALGPLLAVQVRRRPTNIVVVAAKSGSPLDGICTSHRRSIRQRLVEGLQVALRGRVHIDGDGAKWDWDATALLHQIYTLERIEGPSGNNHIGPSYCMTPLDP